MSTDIHITEALVDELRHAQGPLLIGALAIAQREWPDLWDHDRYDIALRMMELADAPPAAESLQTPASPSGR